MEDQLEYYYQFKNGNAIEISDPSIIELLSYLVFEDGEFLVFNDPDTDNSLKIFAKDSE